MKSADKVVHLRGTLKTLAGCLHLQLKASTGEFIDFPVWNARCLKVWAPTVYEAHFPKKGEADARRSSRHQRVR